MMGSVMLVTGGARSGKSAFAEARLAACPEPCGYIATAPVCDEEMKARVEAHQQRRPDSWKTYEIPRRLPSALPDIWCRCQSLLLDCLTLYFSTYLWDHRTETDAVIIKGALAEMKAILDTVQNGSGQHLIMVTNELGCGIVPMERTSRLYRDVIGSINQYAASRADEVYLVACGLPLRLKGES